MIWRCTKLQRRHAPNERWRTRVIAMLRQEKHRDIEKKCQYMHWCYSPTRLFRPPDALAMHKFGHRYTEAPPCTSGSANDRRRTWVIAMLRQSIWTSRKISMHALNFSPNVMTPSTIEHSANIRRCTPRLKMSQTHRRHIGDSRVNIGLETRDIQGISPFKIVGLCLIKQGIVCVLVAKITCCGRWVAGRAMSCSWRGSWSQPSWPVRPYWKNTRGTSLMFARRHLSV